ncbi:MAG: hypothetical protein IAE77_06020 [Prosthecobacter sp.]|uniref:hypothetical protein n=1 Tax=Prosthecobacter sp. TaxID=1965333 RepID=UPI0019F0748F|nr:hypothetical protein [Prosthecobacter sp.]MBE2282997.1 hypothetical protein [Prosthecobacter sp.]
MPRPTMKCAVPSVCVAGVLLLALSSCTLGLGTVASGVINFASRPLAGHTLDYLPHPDLKQWAARPGPRLEVQTGKSVSASLYVRDDELPAKAARKAPRPGSGMKGRAGRLIGQISVLLAASDAVTRDLWFSNSEDDQILDEVPGEFDDKRRQLALNEFPFVLLQGEELLYLGNDEELWPVLARADTHSKVTIITPDGTFFGIARRIHYRRGSSELVLEGDPTVQSGEQHIKGAKEDTVMRLDFKKRRVTASGPVVEKKVFH